MAGTYTTTATNVLGASGDGKRARTKLIAADVSGGLGTLSATTRQGGSSSVAIPPGTTALALVAKLTNAPGGAATDTGYCVIELQYQGEWVQARATTQFLGTGVANAIAVAQIITAAGTSVTIASGTIQTSGGAATATPLEPAEAVRIGFNFSHGATPAGSFNIAAELFAIDA